MVDGAPRAKRGVGQGDCWRAVREDPARELKRLRAENERLRHELAAGRANLQELWQALALIRDAIEGLAPVGAMRSSEAVMGAQGPEPPYEAEELIRGIQAIAAERAGEGRHYGRSSHLPRPRCNARGVARGGDRQRRRRRDRHGDLQRSTRRAEGQNLRSGFGVEQAKLIRAFRFAGRNPISTGSRAGKRIPLLRMCPACPRSPRGGAALRDHASCPQCRSRPGSRRSVQRSSVIERDQAAHQSTHGKHSKRAAIDA